MSSTTGPVSRQWGREGEFSEIFPSDPEKWYGSAGRGVAVPVSAVVEGDANIMGEREHIMIEIDYSDFIEVLSS